VPGATYSGLKGSKMQHDFILLDRSGSMAGRWVEAVGSINAYVEELAKNGTDTGVTLAVFDDAAFDVIRDRIIPTTWKKVAVTEVEPRGGTPLNDATAKLLDLADKGGYDKVAIIIMTDGQENASREYNVAAIKARLQKARDKGWQVIFLGADFDNQSQAAGYGNARGQTVTVSAANLAGTMRHTATMRSMYGMTGQAMAYTDDDKKAAVK
jgi:uncharacterized protein YegL